MKFTALELYHLGTEVLQDFVPRICTVVVTEYAAKTQFVFPGARDPAFDRSNDKAP